MEPPFPVLRVAALYDIHGNLPALQAVMRDVRERGIHAVVLGGDVDQGPLPCETLEVLTGLNVVGAVMGNADREVLDTLEGDDMWARRAQWVAAELTVGQREFMLGFRPIVEVDLPIGRVLFCHGTPTSDEEIVTPLTPDDEIRALLGQNLPDLIVCGHIHMQYDRPIGRSRLVNAGSVGMPYEDAPGAYWLELGATVSLRRSEYDIKAAANTLRTGAYPEVEEFVEHYVETTFRAST